jgi:hypothetical protein
MLRQTVQPLSNLCPPAVQGGRQNSVQPSVQPSVEPNLSNPLSNPICRTQSVEPNLSNQVRSGQVKSSQPNIQTESSQPNIQTESSQLNIQTDQVPFKVRFLIACARAERAGGARGRSARAGERASCGCARRRPRGRPREGLEDGRERRHALEPA